MNYGIHDGGCIVITLTDTMLRLDHRYVLTLHDIEFLTKMHPEDKPTATTIVFSGHWKDAGAVAKPIMEIDHVHGTHDHITTFDRDSGVTAMHIPLLRRVIADTETHLERFRNMGFFSPKATRKPREGLQRDWKRINAGIAVDGRMRLGMLSLYREHYEKRMAFLEECALQSGLGVTERDGKEEHSPSDR